MKMSLMRSTAAIVLLSLAAAGSALADNKNGPIEVSADSFVADVNAKSGTYSGNVLVKQGDMNLHARTIRVSVAGGKPDKIYANGGVVIESPSGRVSGDAGVYDVAPRLITLTGNVVVTQGKMRQTAQTVTYNVATGIVKFGGAVTAKTGQAAQPGGRVHMEFSAPPKTNP